MFSNNTVRLAWSRDYQRKALPLEYIVRLCLILLYYGTLYCYNPAEKLIQKKSKYKLARDGWGVPTIIPGTVFRTALAKPSTGHKSLLNPSLLLKPSLLQDRMALTSAWSRVPVAWESSTPFYLSRWACFAFSEFWYVKQRKYLKREGNQHFCFNT